jgi:hypothetical protein
MNNELQAPRYEAVPTNPQLKYAPEYPNVQEVNMEEKSLTPQPLDSSWGWKIFRACLDSILAAVAILYIVFGCLVLKNDGKLFVSGSQAELVVEISKYVCITHPYTC